MPLTRQILVLIIFIVFCLGIGFVGSFATMPNLDGWYKDIVKPSFNPPDSVFGPVWTFLYVTMAVAAWLVWRKTGTLMSVPMAVFILQLILNLVWSFLFFGLQNPLAGLIDIVFLWVSIILTIILFWKVLPIAGVILIPYLLWVTFATMLNFSIWRLN